jgi:hypothetical protein
MGQEIIQFDHPGDQFQFKWMKKQRSLNCILCGNSSEGIRLWNKKKYSKHKRKYIKQEGYYLKNEGDGTFEDSPSKETIYFWGEWEPQSYFVRLTDNESNKQLPNSLHTPVFSNKEKGLYNTDPFVFGNYFYYTNCKQPTLNNILEGEGLEKGSIIIFGTPYGKSFTLDTVFVVNNIYSEEYYKNNRKDFPDLLREATLDHRNFLDKDPPNKIFTGLMYHESRGSFFSFVPCASGEKGKQGVKRPFLPFKKFNLKNGRGPKIIEGFTPEEFWNKVVNKILEDGYHLGIQVDLPRRLNKHEEENLPEFIPYSLQQRN